MDLCEPDREENMAERGHVGSRGVQVGLEGVHASWEGDQHVQGNELPIVPGAAN